MRSKLNAVADVRKNAEKAKFFSRQGGAVDEPMQSLYCMVRTASRVLWQRTVDPMIWSGILVGNRFAGVDWVFRTIQVTAVALIAALLLGGGVSRAESGYSFSARPGKPPKTVVPSQHS